MKKKKKIAPGSPRQPIREGQKNSSILADTAAPAKNKNSLPGEKDKEFKGQPEFMEKQNNRKNADQGSIPKN